MFRSGLVSFKEEIGVALLLLCDRPYPNLMVIKE